MSLNLCRYIITMAFCLHPQIKIDLHDYFVFKHQNIKLFYNSLQGLVKRAITEALKLQILIPNMISVLMIY